MKSHKPLVFRIDEKLLQHRPPRLTMAATLTALCKRVKAEELDANFVVDILNENHLLPYMIRPTKNMLDISLGRYTNASKIGDLVVSQECIKGSYELCIAFLEFVLTIISNPEYKDTSKTMLASITYLSNEIYTCYYIWTYKNIEDMQRIMCLCTQIFYEIISNTREPEGNRKYTELELVTILSLSQNQGHKQLIDVIVEQKGVVKRKESTDPKQDHHQSQILDAVRKSLFIFDKLLVHSKYLKDFCDLGSSNQLNFSPSHYQDGVSNSGNPMTSIESALFDTSIRPGLLQHIFSYIYQKEDSSIACLAVDLTKNVAKKFTMSLMACLGSEADKACGFFIECLSEKTDPNMKLKITILDLLLTCVEHQPGLIELFLNYKCEANVDKAKESTSSASDSLVVVMELLKDCISRQDETYKLLHTYLMKFILTFWQKHHSTIEQFDSTEEFWNYVTDPLIIFLSREPKTSDTTSITSPIQPLTDKLNSYSLKILAREIFYLNAGISERKTNPKLQAVFDQMSSKDFMGKYSSSVRKKYSDIESYLNHSEDYTRILAAWRDFVVSYAKYTPFEISDIVKTQIVEDVLDCLLVELRLGEKLNKERVASLGDTLLLLWSNWMIKGSCSNEISRSIQELVHLTDAHKEYLPFSFLLVFQSALNLYLVHNREYLVKSERSYDLLEPSVQLMQFSLKIMNKYLNNKESSTSEIAFESGVESRLCWASIMTLRFIIDASRNSVNLWISYLRTSMKTDALIQLLVLLMNKRLCNEICLSIVELLMCLKKLRKGD